MNWKKLISLTLVVLLVIAIAGLAIAQKDNKEKESKEKVFKEDKRIRMMEPGKPGDPFERIANRLGIEPATLEKLRDIHRDIEKKNIRIQADLKIAHMDLVDAIKSGKSSDTEIRRAADTVAKIQSQMIHTKIDALLQAKKLLTPEQYEKMIQVMGVMHLQGGKGQMMQQRRMMQRGPGMKMEGMQHPGMQGPMGQGGFGMGPQFGFNSEFEQSFQGEESFEFAPGPGYGPEGFSQGEFEFEQGPFFAQRPFPGRGMMEENFMENDFQTFEDAVPTPEE